MPKTNSKQNEDTNDKMTNIEFIFDKEEIAKIEIEYKKLTKQIINEFVDESSFEIIKGFSQWKTSVLENLSQKICFKEFEGEILETVVLKNFIEFLFSKEKKVFNLEKIKFYSLIKNLAIDKDLEYLSLNKISNISKEEEEEGSIKYEYLRIIIRFINY